VYAYFIEIEVAGCGTEVVRGGISLIR
jgi:hypothetical protein